MPNWNRFIIDGGAREREKINLETRRLFLIRSTPVIDDHIQTPWPFIKVDYCCQYTSRHIDIINTKTGKIVKRISVGIDPVSVCIRPDGKEVWVSNHVDSISIIDNNENSSTYLNVDTVQELDIETKATNFDEPIGIAFANNKKAYVALSSENKIAAIDVDKKIIKHLHIDAQDPRAITVKNGKLYVIHLNQITKHNFQVATKWTATW